LLLVIGFIADTQSNGRDGGRHHWENEFFNPDFGAWILALAG